jgi:hypothetical protein
LQCINRSSSILELQTTSIFLLSRAMEYKTV